MKKLFFITCMLLVSACSQSDDTKRIIDCKRVGLINKSMHMVLQADENNDNQMRDLGMCFGATVYDMGDDNLKEILNSETKEKQFVFDVLFACQTKLQHIDKQEFNKMVQKALKASELTDKYKDCFKE